MIPCMNPLLESRRVVQYPPERAGAATQSRDSMEGSRCILEWALCPAQAYMPGIS
jgi:hypothetical protein